MDGVHYPHGYGRTRYAGKLGDIVVNSRHCHRKYSSWLQSKLAGVKQSTNCAILLIASPSLLLGLLARSILRSSQENEFMRPDVGAEVTDV
jgi:hypothetical protein